MKQTERFNWMSIVEFVGVFSIVASLIFVGMQVKQDRQVALAASIQDASSNRLYWAELIAEHSDVWVKGLDGEMLSRAEKTKFEALAGALELSYYTAWTTAIELEIGNQERWVRAAALDFHTHPGLMEFWQRHLELQALTDPDSNLDPWLASVKDEIARLEQDGE